jgi:hypothetical protein
MEDPTTERGDAYRLFVHKDARKLRAAVRFLMDPAVSDDDAEGWLICKGGLHWFAQDWRYWDASQGSFPQNHGDRIMFISVGMIL